MELHSDMRGVAKECFLGRSRAIRKFELMEQRDYVRRLLEVYCATPGTCGTARRPDRLLAAQEVLTLPASPEYFRYLRQLGGCTGCDALSITGEK